jgi:hypothetical protein
VALRVVGECADFKLDAAARPIRKTVADIVLCLPEGGQSMNRKPDLLWILTILFGLGVVTTGYAQSLWERKADAPIEMTAPQQQQR